MTAEVVRRALRLLDCWAGGEAEADRTMCRLDDLAHAAGPLLRAVARELNFYRRAFWVNYISGPEMRWYDWHTVGDGPPRLRVEGAAPSSAQLKLRREAPFEATAALAFLNDVVALDEAGGLAPEGGGQVRALTVDVLHRASRPLVEALPGGEELLQPLAALSARLRCESLRAGAARMLAPLDRPAPAGLLACLRELLLPHASADGCLTAENEAQLFAPVPGLTEANTFEAAHAAVAALRAVAQAPEGSTLATVCGLLVPLGQFARLLRVYLGPRRDRARPLLENFEALGRVAEYTLEPSALGDEVEPAPELAPEFLGLAPVVGQVVELYAAVRSLESDAPAAWPELAEALRGLHYPVGRFRQRLERAAAASGDERGALIGDAARQLADEFMSKIPRLDALLNPGPGRPGAATREHLCCGLRAVRELLFGVMHEHGGYDEYPVAVGESLRKHGQTITDVTYVCDPLRQSDEIVKILEPGYVRRRENAGPEMIRPPKVAVAR